MTRGGLFFALRTGPFRNAVRVGLDYLRGMECTVQVLAAHCVLKQSSGIMASPGTMLAPTLSTDREQQQQHILTPASAKDALAQHHAYHCSVCGAARHTHTGWHAHMRTHTHTYTYTHAGTHTHTYKHKRVRILTNTHTHMHTHKHTDTHARAHIQKPKHAGTHTCTHTCTDAYSCTCCARDGLR